MVNKSPIPGVVANPFQMAELTHSMAEKMEVIPHHMSVRPRAGSPSSRKIKKDWIAQARAYQVPKGGTAVLDPPGDAILLMNMKNCPTSLWDVSFP